MTMTRGLVGPLGMSEQLYSYYFVIADTRDAGTQ